MRWPTDVVGIPSPKAKAPGDLTPSAYDEAPGGGQRTERAAPLDREAGLLSASSICSICFLAGCSRGRLPALVAFRAAANTFCKASRIAPGLLSSAPTKCFRVMR